MLMKYKLVCQREVGDNILEVYRSEDRPLFLLNDVCRIIGKSVSSVYTWLRDCTRDEYFTCEVENHNGTVWVITTKCLNELIVAHAYEIPSDVVECLYEVIPGLSDNRAENTSNKSQFYCENLDVFVRVVWDSDVPYFICADLVKFLGYKSVTSMLRHTDPEDRKHLKIDNSKVVGVTESGLFSLLMSSDCDGARAFKRWVTSSVLPSLRKHGAYAVSELLDNPDLLIQALERLKVEKTKNEELHKTIELKDRKIVELEPKAEYYDKVLSSKNAVPVSVIAKDFGRSARWLNKKLHDLGIQYRRGNMWVLYQKYADKGYTSTRTHYVELEDGSVESRTDTVWTQAGREFIWKLLGADGDCMVLEGR